MIDPQENITIGNVLYALGLGIGVQAGVNAPVAAVNLLQQGSYDPVLGDVLLQFTGATRLFEFKRRGKESKERIKHEMLSSAIKGMPRKVRTSRKIHWYVETFPGEEPLNFEYRPYLDLPDRTKNQSGFSGFVDSLVDEALGDVPNVAPRDASEYIEDVVAVWGGGRHHSSTGMLVSVSSSGGLSYVMVDDLADLAKTRSQAFALQMERFNERELAHQRAWRLERELSIERTRTQELERLLEVRNEPKLHKGIQQSR